MQKKVARNRRCTIQIFLEKLSAIRKRGGLRNRAKRIRAGQTLRMHETQSNNSQLEGTGAHELLAARYLEICNPRHPGVIRCEIFIDIPEGAVVGRIDGHARICSPRSYEGRSMSR